MNDLPQSIDQDLSSDFIYTRNQTNELEILGFPHPYLPRNKTNIDFIQGVIVNLSHKNHEDLVEIILDAILVILVEGNSETIWRWSFIPFNPKNHPPNLFQGQRRFQSLLIQTTFSRIAIENYCY